MIAILTREPRAAQLLGALQTSVNPRISAGNWLEVSMVCVSRGLSATSGEVDALPSQLGLGVIEFTPEHAAHAARAFERYGRGRHPAKLNYGDCTAYATAKLAREPLLYVGDDFALTDIESALTAP
ncbi:MAG: type II toxin-antitoxin system VapC family toxin [Microbacteriaceae bacterium]|nr:type II toxin-antitoxin system VapC family toxin [Microbacteriaceae bacterium]